MLLLVNMRSTSTINSSTHQDYLMYTATLAATGAHVMEPMNRTAAPAWKHTAAQRTQHSNMTHARSFVTLH